jgi:plastocyanin
MSVLHFSREARDETFGSPRSATGSLEVQAMKQLAIVFGFAVLLLAPAAAVAQMDYPASGPSMGMPQPQAAGVTIVDFGFQSPSIAVPAGTTVSWYNAGGVSHTVTSTTGAFDSGTIAPGGGFSVTFSTPGTYSYYCAIHPSMTGTVVVTG